jgi:hypothetical protein
MQEQNLDYILPLKIYKYIMDINELESFKLSDAVSFHKELNPKLWEDEKLDPTVREQLLLIAEDFVEYLGISNLNVKDVTISGSNAAYSYTPHSDIDLHVLVDFNELPNNEVYQELFTAKKTLYNDAHDITVRDVPVELYVQDTNNPVQSLGEYSIVHDKWIRIPKKRRANFDQAATKLKYEKLGELIELALKTKDSKRVNDTIALVKRYRKSGLDRAGEFGPENLAYKAVRKQGLVQALHDLKVQLHTEKLSIEEDGVDEDYDPNGPPPGPEFKPTMPAGTVKVDVSDVYDWYKLGQHISNLKGLGKHDFGQGPPSTIMAFGSEPEEHKYIQDLEKTGLTTTDIDPVDPNQPKGMKRQKTDPTYNVNETDDRKAAVLKIQKHLNKKYGANLDLDGKLGPLTLKSINKFMPRAKTGLADEPNKTTAVQGKKLKEASGYIPSAKEKNDPRFKTALTVDVKPDAIKKNAKAFGFKTSRAGIPPQARADGKIAEDLMREFKTFLGEQQEEMFPGYDEQHREKRLGNWLAKSWGVQNGKPQTFYHATTKDFDTFNTHGTGFASALGMAYEVERHGSFFAVDPKFAEGFIEDPNTGRVKEGGRVLPVHLSIQSPIDLRDDALSRMLSDEETVDEFKANNIDLRSIYNHFYELERWELFDGPEGAEFIDNLQKLGFDGAIINEAIPNNSNAKSGQVWVAFSPNQVKSVYNRGSFSPDDNRLMKESTNKFALTPKIISQIEEWRHLCRVDNEGGGACHLVSEIIEGEWGFERQDGTYCTPDQRDICVGHYWNLLPDGSILDSTADQFGEGNNIRIVSPKDPEFKRYHPRFPRDFDYNDDEEYTRITDLDNQRYDKSQEYEKKHGEGWWLKDKKLYNKYKTDQRKYTG